MDTTIWARGERIYKRLRPMLEREHRGDIVAIETESEEYVVGHDELEVAEEAVRRFPGKVFVFFRVGERAVHKLRRPSC